VDRIFEIQLEEYGGAAQISYTEQSGL